MKSSITMPRKAITGIAIGLLLMAIFTMVWTGIAEAGFNGHDHYLILIAFATLSLLFIINGIRLFIKAKGFPKITDAGDKAEGKRIGMWFGIVFGVEGVLIVIASQLLVVFHKTDFMIPVIALIVGLHFYPMAKVFRRTIDYYIATYACIIAIIGLAMVALTNIPQSTIFSVMGVGMALATTAYGIYMLKTASIIFKLKTI